MSEYPDDYLLPLLDWDVGKIGLSVPGEMGFAQGQNIIFGGFAKGGLDRRIEAENFSL